MHLNIVRPMFLLAVVLLFIGANAMWGSAAQDVTPSSHAVHPIVGSWVLSSNADIPPSVYTFGADGAVVGTSVEGTRHGAWRPTGERTALVTVAGLDEAGALVTVYAEISLDATGEGLEVTYYIEPEPEGNYNIMGQNVATGARIVAEPVGPIEMSPLASPAPM